MCDCWVLFSVLNYLFYLFVLSIYLIYLSVLSIYLNLSLMYSFIHSLFTDAEDFLCLCLYFGFSLTLLWTLSLSHHHPPPFSSFSLSLSTPPHPTLSLHNEKSALADLSVVSTRRIDRIVLVHKQSLGVQITRRRPQSKREAVVILQQHQRRGLVGVSAPDEGRAVLNRAAFVAL